MPRQSTWAPANRSESGTASNESVPVREVAILFALPACLAGCETLEVVHGGPVPPATARQAVVPAPSAPRAKIAREEERSTFPLEQSSRAEAAAVGPESHSKPVEPLLTAAVYYFEEGKYGKAEALLRSTLEEGVATREQQTRAHKYLAFVYCVTERKVQCRREFSRALRADPQFGLSAAEAGHPTWGPVFRAVKASR